MKQADETVLVTKDFLESGTTNYGGWRKCQIQLLGVPWPLQKGWRKRIEGKLRVSREVAAEFVRLGRGLFA